MADKKLCNEENWTEPVRTSFTDNDCKFHFGRLPDGRFYYIGCPDPEPLWTRARLILSISKDGVNFEKSYIIGDGKYRIKFPALGKMGNYGYSHSVTVNEFLYVIV